MIFSVSALDPNAAHPPLAGTLNTTLMLEQKGF